MFISRAALRKVVPKIYHNLSLRTISTSSVLKLPITLHKIHTHNSSTSKTMPSDMLVADDSLEWLEPHSPPIISQRIQKGENKILDENLNKSRKINNLIGIKESDGVDRAIESVARKGTVLICIDMESYERGKREVTEIGISIYDPRYQQSSTVPDIISLHVSIKETLQYHNKTYVPDNKFRFSHGASFVLTFKEAKKLVESIIDHYNKPTGINPHPIAFVGHNFSSDIAQLKKMSIGLPENAVIIDTQRIWVKSLKTPKSSLGYVLRRCGIPLVFSHNGGNDAYATLILALKLCDPEFRINRLLNPNGFHSMYRKEIENSMIDKSSSDTVCSVLGIAQVDSSNTDNIFIRLKSFWTNTKL